MSLIGIGYTRLIPTPRIRFIVLFNPADCRLQTVQTKVVMGEKTFWLWSADSVIYGCYTAGGWVLVGSLPLVIFDVVIKLVG